jgi:hypothetical protein
MAKTKKTTTAKAPKEKLVMVPVGGSEYIEPSPRIYQEWSPTLLRMARLQSESGTLRMAAELCDEVLTDDRVKSAFSQRIGGLSGLKLAFSPPTTGNKAKLDEIAKAQEADFFAVFPENVQTELKTWGFMLGVGLAEITEWADGGEEHSGRLIPKVKVWHPRNLRWDWQRRQWFLTTENAGEVPITCGDGRWYLYTPYGENRPWAKGAWRALAIWWLAKRYAMGDWSRYGEVHGNPARVVEAPSENLPGPNQCR